MNELTQRVAARKHWQYIMALVQSLLQDIAIDKVIDISEGMNMANAWLEGNWENHGEFLLLIRSQLY